MSAGYRWVAHQEAVESLLRLPAAARLRLIQHFDGLANDPTAQSEAHLTDQSGRELQLKIAGRHILTYWVDHAAKEIRIVAIETV